MRCKNNLFNVCLNYGGTTDFSKGPHEELGLLEMDGWTSRLSSFLPFRKMCVLVCYSFAVKMLLGNKSYAIEKPVCLPLNGATVVCKIHL